MGIFRPSPFYIQGKFSQYPLDRRLNELESQAGCIEEEINRSFLL
jgi:hypothetical protein